MFGHLYRTTSSYSKKAPTAASKTVELLSLTPTTRNAEITCFYDSATVRVTVHEGKGVGAHILPRIILNSEFWMDWDPGLQVGIDQICASMTPYFALSA